MKFLDLENNVFIDPVDNRKHRIGVSNCYGCNYYVYVNDEPNDLPIQRLGISRYREGEREKFLKDNGFNEIGAATGTIFPEFRTYDELKRFCDFLNEKLTEKYLGTKAVKEEETDNAFIKLDFD